MDDTAETKMLGVLDRLTEHLEITGNTANHSVLSLEKIVAAVITLIVTGVCVWVGSTLTLMSREVIELRSTVSHQNETMSVFVATANENETRLHTLETEFARLGQVRAEVDALRTMVTTIREEQLARTSNVAAVAELKEALRAIEKRMTELDARVQASEAKIEKLRGG